MNKKEIKIPVAAEAIKNADTAQTFDSSPFVAYMRTVVKKTEKEYPGRFLFLIATDPMEAGESSDCFAIVPQDTKFTAGVLSALMVTRPEPLLESITLALHSFIGDRLGESYRDEFDACVSGIFKRARAEMEAKGETEAETTTDEK